MTRLWFFALTLFSISPLAAQFGIEDPLAAGLDEGPAEEWSTARLVSEARTIAAGEPFTVALVLDHPEGWHSYYFNTGGTEKSPEIRWELPEGFSAGPIQWPVPHVIDGLLENKSLTYAGRVVFPVEITPPAELEAGTTVSLTAHPTWQICEQLCKDEPNPDAPQSFTLELPVAGQAADDPEQAALFEQARAALPKPTRAWSFSATSTASGFELRLEPGEGAPEDLGSMKLEFIPDVPYVAPLSDGGSLTREGDQWLITLKRLREVPLIELPIEQGTRISGILEADRPLDTTTGATAIVVPTTEFGKAPPKPLSLGALLPVLLGMFVGGMILNLMPCVFPVLGLKIMGFVQQSGQDRRKIVMHGIAFAVGVLISFWIVSGILFFLRANSTEEISWGYQLQNKWFVYGLVLLFFVFGLSMFGLFEIGASATSVGGRLQSKEGLGGSFFSGVLATIAATPCSAPILGPAIGAAITLPTFQFFTAFTAMALGLALPYLLLSIFPKLVEKLPRPGPWMESFKQAMSFLLLGAAAFFYWVYTKHVADDAQLTVILGLVLIAIAAWVFGRWTTPARSARVRWIGRVLALLFVATGLYLFSGPYKGLAWDDWSEAKVERLNEEGQAVYVDFTARWCATCQLNKKVAYSPEVVALFKERGIVALRADKTRPDPDIDAKIAELGRAAIPVNVLYVPGKEPIVTPELLTADYLGELITKEVPPPAAE